MTNKIHPLFPTVIYQCKVDGHEKWKELLESKTEHHFDPCTFADKYAKGYHLTGEARGKSVMHKDEDLSSFFTIIADNVRECLNSAGIKSDMHDVHFMKSWCTIKEYTDNMSEHNHACSDLSFVYYVNTPYKTGLVFTVPKSPNEYFGGVFDPKPDPRSHTFEDNFINAGSTFLPVEAGDLLVFPGSMRHSVPPEGHKKGKYLRSIAGDIKISLKEEYVNLETGLIHPSHWRTF